MTGDPVEVEGGRAVAHGEVHGGPGGGVQVVEVGRGDLAQARLHGGEEPDPPQSTSDHVVTGPAAYERSPLAELRE